jgi:hypothetical protein
MAFDCGVTSMTPALGMGSNAFNLMVGFKCAPAVPDFHIVRLQLFVLLKNVVDASL